MAGNVDGFTVLGGQVLRHVMWSRGRHVRTLNHCTATCRVAPPMPTSCPVPRLFTRRACKRVRLRLACKSVTSYVPEKNAFIITLFKHLANLMASKLNGGGSLRLCYGVAEFCPPSFLSALHTRFNLGGSAGTVMIWTYNIQMGNILYQSCVHYA